MKGHTDSVQVKQCSVKSRVLEAHISDVFSDCELLIGVRSAFLCWTNQSGVQSGLANPLIAWEVQLVGYGRLQGIEIDFQLVCLIQYKTNLPRAAI